jgi:hypothetical protein
MRQHLLWATLFAAVGTSTGCVTCGHSALDGIPVRRLPDEVLHGPACGSGCELVLANKSSQVKQAQAATLAPEEYDPAVSAGSAPCGSCGGVFYTAGLLGGGEYPLTRDLRVMEAVAVARGPVAPGPSRVTVVRRLPGGQQIPIRVDLDEALRDSRENIPVWPCDLIVLQETPCESTFRVFGRLFHCRPKVAARAATCYPLP